MTPDRHDTELRRYLLGELADEDCAALEEEYFTRQETFDRVWAAENDLIDGYLSGRLSGQELNGFERHYLASPSHRHRVAVARELRAAASAERPLPAERAWNGWWTPAVRAMRAMPPVWQIAAAALVLLAAGGIWMSGSRRGAATVAPSPSPPAQARASVPPTPEKTQESGTVPESPRSAPVVVALSLSPVTVRGADEGTSLIIAPRTDLVVLRLEGETAGPPLGRGRAVVRTVTGKEVWRGPAAVARDSPAALASLEIPAERLTRDDYIVELFGTDAQDVEFERYRYFLRVRE